MRESQGDAVSARPSDVELTAAAERALTPLLGPVRVSAFARLSGSRRTVVLRAVARGADGAERRVVLKAAVGSSETGVREQAALAVLRDAGVDAAVPLLTAADEPPLLVLADLGAGPTLADRLTADIADAAAQAMAAGRPRSDRCRPPRPGCARPSPSA